MPPKSFFNPKKKEHNTTIILPDIDPVQIDKDYNIKEYVENLNSKSPEQSTFITKKPKAKKTNEKKEDITLANQLENMGVVNELKKYEPTVFLKNSDIITKNGPKMMLAFKKSVLDSIECQNLNCWWCRNSIPVEYQTLGCPLKYSNETFYCEGSFCSFNCIKAYIEDLNHYQLKYRDSMSLLLLYYSKIFNSNILYTEIYSAPHWSLLKEYGGSLDINDFRNEFQRIQYYGPSGSLIRDISKPVKTAFTFTER
jgi:hypothetical protein